MVTQVKEINLALARNAAKHAKKDHYPPDERAGFNFGKAICALIEALAVNEDDFIRGMMKPLTSRQNFVEQQKIRAQTEEFTRHNHASARGIA